MEDPGYAPPPVTVRAGDTTYELRAPDGEFTFGRAEGCTVSLDAEDVGISRLAGSIDADGGVWWVTNLSTRRPLSVIDEIGFRKVLAPKQRYALEGRVRVVVDGREGSHELEIVGPARAEAPTGTTVPGRPTAVGADVLIRQDDRMALVALFAGFLEEGPRYDPHPKEYGAAAARLGWPRSTLVKRIEYLRTRLDKAGVPNMMGWKALTNLAEYVLAAKIITKDDLRLLHRDH
ncbi:hypothetical protein [Actinophytocola sp.]|uniref:hypothetical protein n=1 Tax=Actinophytocola sp. TaxID=1872138 RepID=UPI003D6C17D4